MPFVKLDCGILDSTLWVQPAQREVFITALLMAVPHELTEPEQQIEVRSLNTTEFIVPPGWYGFVPAAGVGIIRRAQVDEKAGMDALEALGSPDAESRSPEHDGRRMVRIDGGYLILNFQKYRDRDYTAAERSKRYRARKASLRDVTSSHRDITQAEAEAEAEAYIPTVYRSDTSALTRKKFTKPTSEEINTYCQERKNSVDPSRFIDHYESNGWRVGKNPMKDWKAAVRTWEKNEQSIPRGQPQKLSPMQRAKKACDDAFRPKQKEVINGNAERSGRTGNGQDDGPPTRLLPIPGRLTDDDPGHG